MQQPTSSDTEPTALATRLAVVERLLTESLAIHGDDLCDERTIEKVRVYLDRTEGK
jgi:hypothetical protein